MEARKRSPEGMGRPVYQDLLSKYVRNGLPEGGDSKKSSSMLQGKTEPVVGVGRVLENSMSGSRQDTSGAAEGPLAEPDCGPRVVSGMDGTVMDKRGPPSLPTPKSVGSGIMRGRALRTEDLNMDGFPRSLLKSRGMGPGARTGVQSPMLSFRSLLEGAISPSGVHPSTPVQGIAESGLQHFGLVTIRATPQPFLEGKALSVEGIPEPRKGERNFSRRAHDSSSLSGDTVGDSVPQVSYSSLLQAQLGDNPVEARTDPSDCNRARTLRLNEGTHSPPVKLQSQSAEVDGGFLALLNQTTRLLAPVAQRSSSPRADFMSIGGRASNVAVAGDASRSAEIASERDGGDSLRATAVLASAVPSRAEDDIPRTEAVVERSSLVADSRSSVEDALGTSFPEEGDSPSTVNESRPAGILSERVGIDFSETAAVPRSAVLSRIEEDVSPADNVDVRASFAVTDSAAIEAEMTDAELFEELSRGLAIEESRFAENASNMGAIDWREAAAALPSFLSTRKEQGLPLEEVGTEQSPVVVANSVSTDKNTLDVQLLEQPSGTIGVDNSRSAHNVPMRDATDSSEAPAVPELLVFTRLEEPDLPAGVERASYVVTDSISGDENASGVQPLEEVFHEHALNESRSAGIVSERDAMNLSGAATVPASPVLVGREEDVPRVEVVVAGSAEDDEMSDAYVSDEPSKALALDGLRSPDIVIEGDAANLPEAAAVAASLVPITNGEDVSLSESSIEKDEGLCGDAVVHSEQGNGHLLPLNLSNGQVLGERIQSPSHRLEPEEGCAKGRDGLVDAGTTLVSSCQAGLKQMGDTNADSMNAETILECSCNADLKEMEDVDRDFVGLRKDNLYGVTAAATVVENPRPEVPKQTEKRNALFVEEQNNESCNAYMVSSTENLQLKSKADIDSTKAVLEKELDTSISGPAYSVPLDAGSGVGSSWQAVPKHLEDSKCMVGREQEDNTCHIPVLENLMCQHPGATEEHLMGGDDASGPQRSCVGSFDVTSSTASPHVEGSLLVAECTRTDGEDHAGSRAEEKVEEERIFGGLEGSKEVIKRPEVEQHNFDTLADELPEMQMAILPCSDSPAVNEGFVASKTSYESEELPPSKLVVEPGIQNEEERVPEGHVGEIVDVVMDSGNSGVPADQALSTSPDALSEGLRQLSVRDSDATVSESLESVQVSGAEFAATRQEAGKEVQSPLVMKSKDRHSQDAGDLENRHVTHPDDLENEEQPYALPLNGTVNHELVGAEVEVRPFKKKGRSRAYNHEKALHGTGRPHLQPSGSKRKRQLQYAGNRWRRNRHIDPDQPVPVYIEGRDEGFEEADDDAFTRWLGHEDQGNPAPSPTVRKSARKHVQELVKPVIAIPSFRLVPDYEDRQQEVERRRKVDMQQQLVQSIHEMQTLMSSRTVRASDYDMDDEDEKWLHAWNKRLARGGLKQPISEDKFEEMIEYFERMYAEMEAAPGGDLPGFTDRPKSLAQSVPGSSLPGTSLSGLGCLSINPAATSDPVTEKPSKGSIQKSFKPPAAEHQPSDDCCICNGGEDDETNPVYTCKRCLIHVHQSCYGIREKFRDDEGRVIAPPSWCCRKCEAVAVGTALPNVSCVLCRKRGGALKPTVSPRKWAHVACALYTNETFFVDPDAMEPIDGIAAVAARAQDRQDRCGICGVKRGICSLCSVKYCRAPFHISCGVSQGASFELRQSKQKVVGVRCFCPRHARTTPMDSAPSPRLKQGHLVGSSTTSGAAASATASGSISTASSMDDREERSLRLNTSLRKDGSFADPARQGTSVGTCAADLVDNVISVTGKGTEDAGRGRPNGLRFTLKRKWDESCTQVSEDRVSSDIQKISVNGKGVTGDKLEAPGCKSTWHVVEPGQKLKKIKFKFGKPAQNQDPESSLTLFQQDRIGSGNPEAKKIEVMPAVGEASGDAAAVNDRDAVFVNSLSEDRFAKEVKELTILGEAMKSSLAPISIMREAFVYWRAKRAQHKGSLLCELHHKEWSKSQSIFNKDPSDEGNLATGKLRVPLSRQPSPVSIEKMLEKAKELREQLHRVRSMAQMVVQREKIKCNQIQLALMIASAELNGAESTAEERHCVWCPSTKTLLKCGTCPRSFCFNCFKNRKGFGVKGWMAAAKQSLYSCKYCRELLSNVADLSSNLDPVREEIVDAGLVGTPVIPSEPVEETVRTPVITCEPPALGGRGKGLGKGRDKGWGLQGLHNPGPGPASLPLVEGGVTAPAKGLGIGRGKGSGWTGSDNARPGSSSRPSSARLGSENGANNQSKPSQFEAGFNKFLSITNDQMEHSSFETTLRRLKVLRRKDKDASQEVTTATATGIPAGNTAAEETTTDVRASLPAVDALETGRPSTANGDHLPSPASGPALLVYKKKRRMILSASSESPPSAYDFSDELDQSHPSSSPEDGVTEMMASPRSGVITKRLEIGGLERIED